MNKSINIKEEILKEFWIKFVRFNSSTGKSIGIHKEINESMLADFLSNSLDRMERETRKQTAKELRVRSPREVDKNHSGEFKNGYRMARNDLQKSKGKLFEKYGMQESEEKPKA